MDEELTGGMAAGVLGPRQSRVIAISLVLGGLVLLVAASGTWFRAVTAPIVSDGVQMGASVEQRRGGEIITCSRGVDIGSTGDIEPACEEPLIVRRLVVIALTVPGGVFLVVGCVLLRARHSQPAP